LVAHIEGGTWAEGTGEYGAEEDIWAYKGQGDGSGEGYIMRSFMICTHHQILLR